MKRVPRTPLDLRGMSIAELQGMDAYIGQRLDAMPDIQWGVNSIEFESLLADRRQIRAAMAALKGT